MTTYLVNPVYNQQSLCLSYRNIQFRREWQAGLPNKYI